MAQISSGIDFDDGDYYMFPIKPKQDNALSGTMGELRSTHFHAGLDIRTDGKIGLPIYAAADGYISRAVVKTKGYGRALYVTHPNGETTVYAHLNRFNGPIALHIRNHQYINQSFSTDISLKKGLFSVKKGDIIAYSGNSGSSGGPHLHFEIRNQYQHVLNPLLYHFEEIKDRTPPVLKHLLIRPFGESSRVNHQFTPLSLKVSGQAPTYFITDTLLVHGTVGFGVYAYDWLDHSHFRCAITEINMKKDGMPLYSQKINSFKFSEQKNILAHMDYGLKVKTGKRYHKLYVDNGNFLPFYTTGKDKGKVSLDRKGKHKITIDMLDPYGNKSTLTFYIKHETPARHIQVASASSPRDISKSLYRNILSINAAQGRAKSQPAKVYIKGQEVALPPSYSLGEHSDTYLWNMKQGIPDSILISDLSERFHYKAAIPSGTSYRYYGNHMNIFFPKGALFDTLYLEEQYKGVKGSGPVYQIGDAEVPLRKGVTISLKGTRELKSMEKPAAYEIVGSNGYAHVGGKWKKDKFEFTTRYFGSYIILNDTVPPEIKPLTVSSEQLRFQISDKLSGIRYFKATINGQWVLMNYDYKRNLIWSEKLNPKSPFRGKVVLTVTDKVGNTKHYSQNL